MRTLLPILVVLTFALPGCNFPKVPRVKSPSATVTGATLTDQSAEGAAFSVTVELENPNDFALPVTFAHYRVEVADETYAFTGKAGASMPPMGAQTLTLHGAVPTNGQDLAGAPFKASGHVEYVKPGEVRRVLVESGWPEPELHFAGSGTLQ